MPSGLSLLASLLIGLSGLSLTPGCAGNRTQPTVVPLPSASSFAPAIEIESKAPEPSKVRIGGGTEVCARCGAVREVELLTGSAKKYDVKTSPEQTWADAHIGACLEHCWEKTGCWVRHSSRGRRGWTQTSCFMLAEEHLLWKALARLEPEHANQMARRFADLPKERLIELWHHANRVDRVPEPSDAGLAQAVAEEAGWSDLAAYWAQ